MMFFEDDEDGDPFGELTLPIHGPSVVYQIPGFDIFGMNDASSLSLEVLLRPVANSSPLEQRTLWYWNPANELVQPAPVDALRLLARDSHTAILSPTDLVAPSPLLLSDEMTGQQGFHNHGLLTFALDNSPSAPAGAYGFFARLTSNSYAPSDPFLVVLNRNNDYDKMHVAALAINAAALATRPGDYDGNGQVEPADYQYWRERFGNQTASSASPDGNGNGIVDAADYVIWRNFVLFNGASAKLSVAPEPAALSFCCLLPAFGLLRRRPDRPSGLTNRPRFCNL
jgi:hypothetical protein